MPYSIEGYDMLNIKFSQQEIVVQNLFTLKYVQVCIPGMMSDCLQFQEFSKEKKVARVTGYQMEPMKLSLVGCIEPAL